MVSFKKFANMKLDGMVITDGGRKWLSDYHKTHQDDYLWECGIDDAHLMMPDEFKYDIELGNLIDKQVVEDDGYHVPRTIHKVEVKYYQHKKLGHEEIGCLYKYKYSKGIGLEVNNSNDTYSFNIGIN